jgi:hypothetical protein
VELGLMMQKNKKGRRETCSCRPVFSPYAKALSTQLPAENMLVVADGELKLPAYFQIRVLSIGHYSVFS